MMRVRADDGQGAFALTARSGHQICSLLFMLNMTLLWASKSR